jgi:predicted ATP-dependent serine protease
MVLYDNMEENLQGGTVQSKCRNLQVRSPRIVFLDSKKLDDLKAALESEKYKYCIMDSLTARASNRNETFSLLKMAEEFPKISFVYILHADKTKKTYIGPSTIGHMVDIALEVKNGIAYIDKNRFKDHQENNEFYIFRKN